MYRTACQLLVFQELHKGSFNNNRRHSSKIIISFINEKEGERMIYSVTLNPSIDFIVRVKDFQIGETNRAYEDNFFAGGKGIMVSKLLKN